MKKSKDKSETVKIPEIVDSESSSEDLLPAVSRSREVESARSKQPATLDALTRYLNEIDKYPLLSIDQERELTRAFKESGDIELAKKLVQANLRLVVKIAMEYKRAYQNVLDLIQEGNIGLMKAVSKYEPDKGAKLSYYASWWIRSYILKFILDNFRLVKIGTTAEQKKLFFNLLKEKDRLAKLGIVADNQTISQNLGVSEKSVALMDQRLGEGGSELSLDYQAYDDSTQTLGDQLAQEAPAIDEKLAHLQNLDILKQQLQDFLEELPSRDREIFQNRLLNEVPLSLQAIADQYGVSRERIRQIEERLLKKLKVYMAEYLR